jgi:hypothetical protein
MLYQLLRGMSIGYMAYQNRKWKEAKAAKAAAALLQAQNAAADSKSKESSEKQVAAARNVQSQPTE